MTDRFKVPEDEVEITETGGRFVREGDVPRIVRAEVKRALDAEAYDIDFRDTDYYLAQRFGEAAPENTKPPCGMGDDNCRDGVTACTLPVGRFGRVVIVAALPILRRMHFAEAADLIEQEIPKHRKWSAAMAAQFLRGLNG